MSKSEIPKHVGFKQLCDFLQFSIPTVHKFAKMGMPKDAHGKYPLKECVGWVLAHYRTTAPKKRESPSTEAARKLVYDEQAEKLRMENAQTRGELIAIDDAKQFLLFFANIINSRLEGLPSRLTHEPSQRAKLLEECRDIRLELARAIETASIAGDPRPQPDATTEQERSRVGGSASDDAARDTDSRAVA